MTRRVVLVLLLLAHMPLEAQRPRIIIRRGQPGVGGGVAACNGSSSPVDENLRPRMVLSVCTSTTDVANISTNGDFHGGYKTLVDYWDSWVAGCNTSTLSGCSVNGQYLGGQAAASLAYVAYMRDRTTGIGTTPGPNNYDYTAQEYANYADAVFKVGTRIEGVPGTEGQGSWGAADAVYPYAHAYDWAHSYLGSNRAMWQSWLCKLKDVSTATQGTAWVERYSHSSGEQLVAALAVKGDSGLAAACSTWATNVINGHDATWRGTSFATDGIIQSETDIVGIDGGDANGRSYGQFHELTNNTVFQESYRTAKNIAVGTFYGSGTEYLKYFPIDFFYAILPKAGASGATDWRGHRDFYQTNGFGIRPNARFRTGLGNVMGIVNDVGDTSLAGLYRWLAENRLGRIEDDSQDINTYPYWVWRFLMRPPSEPAAVTPAAYGLAANKCRGIGECLFRVDFTSAQSGYLSFWKSKWLTDGDGREPTQSGSIFYYRNGQIFGARAYGGHEPCGAPIGTCGSHLIFPDRTVSAFAGNAAREQCDDCGGQRLGVAVTNSNGSEDLDDDTSVDILGKRGQSAIDNSRSVIADGSTNLGHYQLVDTTGAYESTDFTNSGRTAKVSSVVRQLVYFPATTNLTTEPDVIFIFDQATVTSTNFAMEFQLNFVGAPSVSGADSSTTVSVGDHTHPRSLCTAPNCVVTATNTLGNADNKVAVTAILPASHQWTIAYGANANGDLITLPPEVFNTVSGTASSNTCTLVLDHSHHLHSGESTITVSGVTPSGYNVTNATATRIAGNSVSYACTAGNSALSANGMAWGSDGYRRDNPYATGTISSLSASGGTVTVTTSGAHGRSTGHLVNITGVTPHCFNKKEATVTVTSTTTFTYAASCADGAGAVITNDVMVWNVPQSHERENPYGLFLNYQTTEGPGLSADLRSYMAHGLATLAKQGARVLTDQFLVCIEGDPNDNITPATCTGAASATMGAAFWSITRGVAFPLSGINNTNCGSSCSFTVPSGFNGTVKLAGFSPSGTRTVDPDANCTLNGGAAGASASIAFDSQGQKEMTFNASAACVVTVQ